MMRVRIRERRGIQILLDAPDGEFGKVHPMQHWHLVEELGTGNVLHECCSFYSAQKWSKKNKHQIVEVC
ncbi:MAG: hypothetical protein HYZ21_11590 [Chloroflexi bacterium]|nr:hypothetical protein [Chloroflexota bacterium]